MRFIPPNQEDINWIYVGIPDFPSNFFNDIITIGTDLETGILNLKSKLKKSI